MKRYRVVLRWTGPKPGLNKAGLATYVIDVSDDDSVRQAIRCALLIAPRADQGAPSPYWVPVEVWEQVSLLDAEGESLGGWEDKE